AATAAAATTGTLFVVAAAVVLVVLTLALFALRPAFGGLVRLCGLLLGAGLDADAVREGGLGHRCGGTTGALGGVLVLRGGGLGGSRRVDGGGFGASTVGRGCDGCGRG